MKAAVSEYEMAETMGNARAVLMAGQLEVAMVGQWDDLLVVVTAVS